ncbi:MAG: ribonuclease H-like domain-containing protein [Promethearchaeota archaeon]
MNIINLESLRSFDIAQLVEKYQNKKLEDLFPNHKVNSNEMGFFLKFYWELDEIPSKLNLLKTRDRIFRNLKTVIYIGEITEEYFQKRGFKTLHDLKMNLKYSRATNELINLIQESNYKVLRKNKYINDFDLSFCFQKEDFLFIDIESLGIYDSPVIMIGLGFYRDEKFFIEILFARDYEEEISIVEQFKNEFLNNYKVFITYNGKTFDIPYLANRFLHFYDENPMITENDTPYEDTNTIYHHIDLYHQCRRTFKDRFKDYTLTTMEQKLLNFHRVNNLPSGLVGVCYRKYLENPKRYVGLIKECIEHNFYDVYSMPLIYKKLLDS